jgi:hypothetical protein
MEGRGGECKVGGGVEGFFLRRCINQYPSRTAKVRVGERERERERER